MDCQPSQREDPQTLFTVKLNLASATFLVIFGLLLNTITVIFLFLCEPVFAILIKHFFYVVITVSIIISIFAVIFNKMMAHLDKKMKFFVYCINCALPAFLLINYKAAVLTKTCVYTLFVTVGMFLSSLLLPDKFSKTVISPLSLMNFFFIILSSFTMILKNYNDSLTVYTENVSLYGGIVVFSGLLICNFHRLYENSKQESFDSIFSALFLYVNIMNLFSKIVSFNNRDYYIYPESC